MKKPRFIAEHLSLFYFLDTIITAVLMICTMIFLTKPGTKALLFAIILYLYICFFKYFLITGSGMTFLEILKRTLLTAGPVIIAYVLVLILGKYLKNDFVENMAKVFAAVFVALIIFDFTYYIKKLGYDLEITEIKETNPPFMIRTICRLAYILSRVTVLLGAALTIFVAPECVSIAIFGCVFWGIRVMVARYCWARMSKLAESSVGDGSNDVACGSNSNDGRKLSDSDVMEIIENIAFMWDGREQSTPHGDTRGILRYSVAASLDGCRIDYTVGGKITNINDNYKEEARSYWNSHIDSEMKKIEEETKRELSKRDLPYSEYYIYTHKGIIE